MSGKDFKGNSTDTIPVERFIGPACVIDIVDSAKKNPDHLVTIEHIEDWEKKNGRIPAGAWVLIRSDWSKRTNADEFLNFKADRAVIPDAHADAVPFLAKERDVRGVGVETVGTDAGQAFTFTPAFPCHSLMHGNNKFGLASLTNLDKLPPTGAIIIAAPLKIVRGSGSPEAPRHDLRAWSPTERRASGRSPRPAAARSARVRARLLRLLRPRRESEHRVALEAAACRSG